MLASAALATGAAGSRPPPAHALRSHQAALLRAQQRAVLDLYAYESRLAGARVTLADVESRLARLTAEHARLLRQATVVRHSLLVARERLARTLRSLYKQGRADPVAILLGAASMDEAVAGIDDLRRAAKANRRLIERLRQTERRVHVLDARLRAQRRTLANARNDAVRAVAGLSQATRSRASALTAVRGRLDLTGRALQRLDRLARTAQRRSARITGHRPPVLTTRSAEVTPPVLPAPGGTRRLAVDAVAYHLPGRTASGLPVGTGVVAVDPSVIPLGTRMFVPGYGSAVAADVGSAVKGYVIDLWMPSGAQALAWGRRSVTITVYG